MNFLKSQEAATQDLSPAVSGVPAQANRMRRDVLPQLTLGRRRVQCRGLQGLG